MDKKTDWKELAARLFCFAFAVFAGILFFRYVFVAFVPFLIAWAISVPIYPASCALSRRTRIPRRICSFVLMLLFLALIVTVISLVAGKIVSELVRLWNIFLNDGDKVVLYFRNVFSVIGSVGSKLPFLHKLEGSGLEDKLTEVINEIIIKIRDAFIARFGQALPDAAIVIAKGLPSVIFVSVVTVVASFYFSMDVDLVHGIIRSYLPEKGRRYIAFLKKRVFSAVRKYLRAYIIIFLITFFELLAGLLILRINYAFLIAFAIAAVDIFPILGTGTVLVPWAAIMLIMGDHFAGIGLIVLYAVITIARQAFEPKILGDSMGMHPLVTLMGMYLGCRLFGVAGLILVPMVIMIVFSCIKDGSTGEVSRADKKKRDCKS